MKLNTTAKVATVAGALVLGSVIGVTAGSASTPDEETTIRSVSDGARGDAHTYSVNGSGLTYGAAPEEFSSWEELPDLVLVYTTKGDLGYVPKEIMFPPAPEGLQDPARKSIKAGATTPVYASDGKTVIGEFEFTPVVEEK